MKRRINHQVLMISALAVLFTVLLTAGVFYEVFEREVMNSLKTYAELLTKNGNRQQIDGIRITVVSEDGTVIYDSDADTSKMGNHLKRPEISEAFKKGSGTAKRHSETLDRMTFYYALKQSDQTVLRVAKEAGSLYSMMKRAIPYICFVVIWVFVLSAFCSHVLTKKLVAPIEEVANNMEHCESVSVYKELKPIVATIQNQHESIIRNATMRQDFTANVSHELKTPLTAISGYAELIENGMANPEETTRFAGEIHQNSKRLLILINDIIRLSELDSMDTGVVMEELDIYQIAENCVEMLRVNAKNNQVSIGLSGCSQKIMANKEMMDELLYNLCDNAIRYNVSGGNVFVSVTGDQNKAVLTVSDTGIGISPENQKRVFERFYRVDKSRSKATGGTGLGLAIVKHVLAQHPNSSLNLESEVGKGTKMQVTFLKEHKE